LVRHEETLKIEFGHFSLLLVEGGHSHQSLHPFKAGFFCAFSQKLKAKKTQGQKNSSAGKKLKDFQTQNSIFWWFRTTFLAKTQVVQQKLKIFV